MSNFINRSIDSGSYHNAGTGALFPNFCGEDLTRIIGQCANTNKKIKSIDVELQMISGIIQATYNFSLTMYYYDPSNYLKILKSDPTHYTSPRNTPTVILPVGYNPVCGPNICDDTKIDSGVVITCSGSEQVGYHQSSVFYAFDITVVAISCGVQNGGLFNIYLLVDNFLDSNNNPMPGSAYISWLDFGGNPNNKWATLNIFCPIITNDDYRVVWTPLGVGLSIDTCIGDTPKITNITVVQQ